MQGGEIMNATLATVEGRTAMPHHRPSLIRLLRLRPMSHQRPMLVRLMLVMGLFVTCTFGKSAHAGVLAPVKASDMRTLRLSTTPYPNPPCPNSAPFKFDTVLGPDGSTSPFTIPAGEVFVVT